ncbi:zinc-containing alcohol dehydrogenase [Sparganum proliferum]
MGSPISGFIAEAVLQWLESLVFQNHIPKLCTRYEDDTFILIERYQVLTFEEHLHTVFPDIQFTMEEEDNNQLVFLYVLVCRKDCGGLKTKVFRKATNTMQALNFNSNHPISHKRCCVRTLYRHVETYYNICEMPIERGPCKDDLIRYGYDRGTGKCKKFSYGGCGGNENIFLTQTGCERSTLRCSSNATVDICNIPIRKGRCRASLERYGYNSETGKCKKFIFGGCDGNENNFHSKKECEIASRQCSSNDICEMPIERGPCKDDLIRYGYDRGTGKCKKFSYGGCGGNENIFLTQTGCERSTLRCSSNATVDICNIPIKKGRCRASLERYGYNSETGKCKKFIFGGCDGNENNFHSKKGCEIASRQCSSNDICEMPIERGPCNDDLIRYGYDRETGKCKKFSYGGCGGNENIFLTQSGCERSTLRCSSNATVDICNIPIKKGRCRASLERYGYNSETGKCKKFIFGGCDGNENNFHSKKECEMASRQCSSNEIPDAMDIARDDDRHKNAAYIRQRK